MTECECPLFVKSMNLISGQFLHDQPSGLIISISISNYDIWVLLTTLATFGRLSVCNQTIAPLHHPSLLVNHRLKTSVGMKKEEPAFDYSTAHMC